MTELYSRTVHIRRYWFHFRLNRNEYSNRKTWSVLFSFGVDNK